MTRRRSTIAPRLCLTYGEAADALGIGESHFREKVLPHVDTVDVGTKRLVVLDSLTRWVDEHRVSASALREQQERVGRSSSPSAKASAPSSARESATSRRLAEKLERYTKKHSTGKSAQIIPLLGSREDSLLDG